MEFTSGPNNGKAVAVVAIKDILAVAIAATSTALALAVLVLVMVLLVMFLVITVLAVVAGLMVFLVTMLITVLAVVAGLMMVLLVKIPLHAESTARLATLARNVDGTTTGSVAGRKDQASVTVVVTIPRIYPRLTEGTTALVGDTNSF